jgi:purine-binding chemotaxis protein CheW
MRRRLELPDFPENELPINIVIRTEGGPVSLLVDEIGDVLEVNSAFYERPPETLRGPARELIQGAYKLDGRLLLKLNSEKAVSVVAKSLA